MKLMFDAKPETVDQLQIKLKKCKENKLKIDKMIKDLIEMGYQDEKDFGSIGKKLVIESKRLYGFAGSIQNAIDAGGSTGSIYL